MDRHGDATRGTITISERPAAASGAAPLATGIVAGGVVGTMVGMANDLGGARGALAGLIGGAVIGGAGSAGMKLLPGLGVDSDLAKRTMTGAALTGAVMGTLQLHGALQMSNPNGIIAAIGLTAAAGLVGAALGAGYHAVRGIG